MFSRSPVRCTLLAVGLVAAALLNVLGTFPGSSEAKALIPRPGNCRPGYTCASVASFAGGCDERSCCEAGEATCGQSWVKLPYPTLTPDQYGTCSKTTRNARIPWCEQTDCGDASCADGCQLGDTVLVRYQEILWSGPCVDLRE